MDNALVYERFIVNHLNTINDTIDLLKFKINRPEGYGLQQYIKYTAVKEESADMLRTYIVRDINTNEVVGYYSLKAGLISINERVIEDNGKKRIVFDTVPGIELANFAVNDSYKENHKEYKGIGKIIFSSFVVPTVKKAKEYIGVRILYIFALPYDTLIDNYSKYGFKRLPENLENELHNRIKPLYDDECKFMFMKI